MSNTKNRGFVTNTILALKDFIIKPRLTREQKKFIIEDFKASQQEIKDLIAKYFYIKEDDGTYDLKDDNLREIIIRLIEINSVIHLGYFAILEKYCDGIDKELVKKSFRNATLTRKEQLCFEMIEFSATQSLYHSTLTEKEELVRGNGIIMYRKLYIIYRFELLEAYLKDKKREALSLEDQALYDVIQKYGANRKKGDIIIFEVKDAKLAAEDVYDLTDAGDSEDFDTFIEGVKRHKAKIGIEPRYDEFSYDALKKERAKLYQALEAKEHADESR